MLTSRPKRIPPIKSVMTPFPYSIELGEPVDSARTLMAEHDIRHLPVIHRGKLVGIVRARDIEFALDPARGLGPKRELRVKDVCDRGVFVVELTRPLDEVLLHMANEHLDSALVVKDGRLAGIFTLTDACRSFGELLRSVFPPGDGEDAA